MADRVFYRPQVEVLDSEGSLMDSRARAAFVIVALVVLEASLDSFASWLGGRSHGVLSAVVYSVGALVFIAALIYFVTTHPPKT
jgi:hypothetical protein